MKDSYRHRSSPGQKMSTEVSFQSTSNSTELNESGILLKLFKENAIGYPSELQ